MKKIFIFIAAFMCFSCSSLGQTRTWEVASFRLSNEENSYCSDYSIGYSYSRDYNIILKEEMTIYSSLEFQIDFNSAEISSMSFDAINSAWGENISSGYTVSTGDSLSVDISLERAVTLSAGTHRLGCVMVNLTDRRPLESTVITRGIWLDNNHVPGYIIPNIDLALLLGNYETEPPVDDSIQGPSDSSLYVPNIPDELRLKILGLASGMISFEFYPLANHFIIISSDSGKINVEVVEAIKENE